MRGPVAQRVPDRVHFHRAGSARACHFEGYDSPCAVDPESCVCSPACCGTDCSCSGVRSRPSTRMPRGGGA